MHHFRRLGVSLFFAICLLLAISTSNAHAEKIVVTWGKITLKAGHIGKVIINHDTQLYQLNQDTNQLSVVRTLTKGNEYGIYTKKIDTTYGVLYGLGANQFVKDSKDISYQTPSKDKKELIGAEKIWLRNPGEYLWSDSKGQNPSLTNLQEAILISKTKNTLYDDRFLVKIKIGSRYFTNDYIDRNSLWKYWLEKNPYSTYKFSNSIWDMIRKEKVQLGMTTKQAVLSWGEPDDINSSNYGYGTFEQWVYGDPLNGAQYLYFENGKLSSWQNF